MTENALQTDYAQLQQAYQTLVDETASASDKITEADQVLEQAQIVQHEFEALRASNQYLASDLEQLRGHTDKLIELVETYRQAALEAVQQAEAAEAKAQAAPASSETEPEDQSEAVETGSKAEAVRETLRKKTVLLLRHRLGKVPRKINQSLKGITQNAILDKLFELALSVETLEAFEVALEKESALKK